MITSADWLVFVIASGLLTYGLVWTPYLIYCEVTAMIKK